MKGVLINETWYKPPWPATIGAMENDKAKPLKRANRLHGDPDPRTQVERMIRVDHAGEYGAARIYQGQLAVLGRHPVGDEIRAMAAQEQRHLETFSRMVVERRVRPTALTPVWHVAGYALGVATAMMGERAAMACTVAIEEQQARPTDGKKSCFTSGLNYGKLLGWLETDAVPLIVVRPRAWQKVFGIGGRGTDTKAQAALVCRRLFPCVDLLATARCRKPHSGKADALLIAEWMRRRWHGKGAEDA